MEMSTPEHTKGKPSPTMIGVKHIDMPEMEGAQLGDKVHLHVHGTVKSVRAKDEYSDGETSVEVHHMHAGDPNEDGVTEGDGPEPSEEEARTMPLDKLRKRLPHKD
jgi:hypothetical protein